jgi:methionine-rich copper-binding protein CopC
MAAIAENKNAISVNPNPVVNGAGATVNYTTSQQGKTTLKVVNMYGRIIQTTQLGLQKQGTHTYTINFAKQLAAGSYYVVIEQDNKMIGKTEILVMRTR